jgi:hypothetical protein
VSPMPVSPMPVSSRPFSPMPVSPPMQRPPYPMAQPYPPQPYPPQPYPPRPLYAPAPPPQIVYQPYPVPMMMPLPIRKGPWSIRWPAAFMTTYAILLYILTALLLLAAGLPHLFGDNPPEGWDGARIDQVTTDSLEWAVISIVAATLLINGATRARRPGRGHHWYPLALCVIVAVSNAALTPQGGDKWTLIPAGVFALSTAMLLLPGSRRWMRRPRKPPVLPPPGSAQAPAG